MDSNPHGFTRQILSSSRIENQQLAGVAINGEEFSQVQTFRALTHSHIFIARNSSGLLVGTKLGTVPPLVI